MSSITKARPGVLWIFSGIPVLVSMLLPWWDEQLPLSLATHWPKVALAAGIALIFIGVGAVRGSNVTWLAFPAIGLLAVSHVGFYFRVDNSRYFAEAPFTEHVGGGFFLALLGLALAGITLLGQVVVDLDPSRRRQVWVSMLATSGVVAVTVFALYGWTSGKSEGPGVPKDERPPTVKTDDQR